MSRLFLRKEKGPGPGPGEEKNSSVEPLNPRQEDPAAINSWGLGGILKLIPSIEVEALIGHQAAYQLESQRGVINSDMTLEHTIPAKLPLNRREKLAIQNLFNREIQSNNTTIINSQDRALLKIFLKKWLLQEVPGQNCLYVNLLTNAQRTAIVTALNKCKSLMAPAPMNNPNSEDRARYNLIKANLKTAKITGGLAAAFLTLGVVMKNQDLAPDTMPYVFMAACICALISAYASYSHYQERQNFKEAEEFLACAEIYEEVFQCISQNTSLSQDALPKGDQTLEGLRV